MLKLHCPRTRGQPCPSYRHDILRHYGLRRTFHGHRTHLDFAFNYWVSEANPALVLKAWAVAGQTFNYADVWEIFPLAELFALQTGWRDEVSADTECMSPDDLVAIVWRQYRGIYALDIPSRTAAGEALF